jgi:hypothetical protein
MITTLKILQVMLVLFIGLSLAANSQKYAPMKLSSIEKYFSSAVFNIKIDDPTKTIVWDPRDFTISYPFAFSDPVAGIFLSIANILTEHTTKGISFHG